MTKWTITAMDCRQELGGNLNVVCTAHWLCDNENSENSSSIAGSCGLPEPDDSFTPYQDLTQEQVLEWVWLSGVDKDATEAAVQLRVSAQSNVAIVTPPLPWVQE